MAHTIEIERNAGHPWDSRPGFDLMYVNADTKAEMDKLVVSAGSKFWKPWLIGQNDSTGLPGGLMYKPCSATAPWEDDPKKKYR